MNNEYVIINKTEWLKVMENNQKPESHHDGIYVSDAQNARADLIEKILSKSTPLIPVVEKSISFCWFETKKELPHLLNIQSDYISNLKLNI